MDPHAFFRRAEKDYYKEFGNNLLHFNARPCDYMVFRQRETSTVVVDQGKLYENDILSFIGKACDTNTTQELRIIFSPARQDDEPMNFEYIGTAIPFRQDVFKDMTNRLHFHKTCFERRNHEDIGRVIVGNVTTFFLSSWRHKRGNNTKVFISSNNQSHVTTIFVHDGLSHELNYIRGRLQEPSLLPLTIHPLLILVFIVEILVETEVGQVDEYYREAISRLPRFTDGEVVVIESMRGNVEKESRSALWLKHKCDYASLCLEILQGIPGMLSTWSKEYDVSSFSEQDKSAFKEAEAIICHRLDDLFTTIRGADRLLRTTIAYNEVHRNSLDIKIAAIGGQLNLRIAAQSRDIALDSRRDSSAMKAIAVLTMLFLPGTFVSACFAMPLFNWNAPTSSLVINPRFWIYAVITIPLTAAVLVVWRIWYRFEEWKQWQGRGDQSFFRTSAKELYKWMRSGRPRRMKEVEDDIKDFNESRIEMMMRNS